MFILQAKQRQKLAQDMKLEFAKDRQRIQEVSYS